MEGGRTAAVMPEPSTNPDSESSAGNPSPDRKRYQRDERSREQPAGPPEPSPPPPPSDPYQPQQQDPLPTTPPPPQADTGISTDKKLIAGLMGILLGGLGVHKFYLGYTQEGIIMLAVTLGVGVVGGAITCGLLTPAMIPMSVIGLIEGILYLTKTDEEFTATYVTGRKPWF